MGSGTILMQAIKAAEMLKEDFGVTSDIWSATSFNELARDGQDCARWNRLNPLAEPRVPFVTETLAGAKGPIIVATDYMKNFAEQIRGFVEQPLHGAGHRRLRPLGQPRQPAPLLRGRRQPHRRRRDGTSSTRPGPVSKGDMQKALSKYDIDGGKPNPRLV